MQSSTPRRNILEGEVISARMDKTIVVMTKKRVLHPLYKKYYTKRKKYYVHDPENNCSEGDRVRIVECRPLSKTKRWKLIEIISKVR